MIAHQSYGVQRSDARGGLVSHNQNGYGSRSLYEFCVNHFNALSNPRRKRTLELEVDRFRCARAICLALSGLPGVHCRRTAPV